MKPLDTRGKLFPSNKKVGQWLHRQRVEPQVGESKRVVGPESASSYLTTLRLCKDRRSFRSQHVVYLRYERLYRFIA